MRIEKEVREYFLRQGNPISRRWGREKEYNGREERCPPVKWM